MTIILWSVNTNLKVLNEMLRGVSALDNIDTAIEVITEVGLKFWLTEQDFALKARGINEKLNYQYRAQSK